MKLGSLFDGSGTCPLAASAVGIIPAWASEIEPFPKAVTQSRFPKMVHLGDITETLVLEPIGADFYNQAITGGVTMTLAAARPDHHHLPCALIPYTLKIRSGCEGGGKGALIQEDKSATLSCNNDQTLFVPTQTENGEVIYLARKLTPTECASLQGFEKDWCALVPHKDSAEYKMWGNGMAFPCMLYIMEGVQEVLAERYLDNLFGGDTTEP